VLVPDKGKNFTFFCHEDHKTRCEAYAASYQMNTDGKVAEALS
jgi:hypothetical protein